MHEGLWNSLKVYLPVQYLKTCRYINKKFTSNCKISLENEVAISVKYYKMFWIILINDEDKTHLWIFAQ